MKLPDHALWNAFEDGFQIESGNGTVSMQCQDVGSLVLPTGRIVACDPQFDLVQEPFSIRVQPDEYPIFLSLADSMEVALAMIQFEVGQPTRWVRTEPSQFSVDSGIGCFMDAKLARMLSQAAENNRFARYWKRITDEMEENNGLWGNACLHADSGANLIAFRTMGGDGSFCTFFGYSDNDELLCLVTDFFLESI